MALRISLSGCRWTAPIRIDKSTQSSLFLEVFLYRSTGQTRSIPKILLLCSYSFLSSYPGSAAIYNTAGKENTEELGEQEGEGEEGEVKETYIWLSCTLAVVKSAVKGTIRSPAAAAVVDVRCSLYPKTHPPCVTVSPPCIRVNART